MRHVPDWSMPHMAGYFLQRASLFKRYCKTEIVREGSSAYIVIGIRRCVRGYPLLPVRPEGDTAITAEESTWICPSQEEFTCFSGWLRTFCIAMGVELPVYDSLDGRHLV